MAPSARQPRFQDIASVIVSPGKKPGKKKGQVEVLDIALNIGRFSTSFQSAETDAVVAALDMLKGKMDDFIEALRTWDTYHPAVQRGFVAELEQASRAAGAALFDGGGELFLKALKGHRVRHLNVTLIGSPTLWIPWDFLVLSDEGWLGKFVVTGKVTSMTPARLADEFLDPEDWVVVTGYAEDNTLESARQDDRPAAQRHLEEYWVVCDVVDPGLSLDELQPLLTSGNRKAEVTKLQEWVAKPRRLLHFNCHSKAPDRGDASTARIGLRRDFDVAHDDILHADKDLNGGAVFLNICSSAAGRYSDRESLASRFMDQNAGVVCATTGPVPDRFATMFARCFYAEAKQPGVSFEEALQRTRVRLLEEWQHPLPLMYTLLGQGDLTLRRAA